MDSTSHKVRERLRQSARESARTHMPLGAYMPHGGGQYIAQGVFTYAVIPFFLRYYYSLLLLCMCMSCSILTCMSVHPSWSTLHLKHPLSSPQYSIFLDTVVSLPWTSKEHRIISRGITPSTPSPLDLLLYPSSRVAFRVCGAGIPVQRQPQAPRLTQARSLCACVCACACR